MKIPLVDYFYLVTPSNWYRDLKILTGTKCGRFILNTLTSKVLVLPADDWSRGSLNDPLICINSHIMQDFMDRSLKKPKVEWTFSPLGVTYMYFEHLNYTDTARTKYTTFIKDIQGTEFSRVWVFVPNNMNMRLYRMGKNWNLFVAICETHKQIKTTHN